MLEELLMDLQLFAGPKVPPEEVEKELEEELEDEEEESGESEDESEDDDEGEEEEIPPAKATEKPKKDKVTAALIRQKQENKALRDKLALQEKEKADRELDASDKRYREKLISEGYNETEVEDRVLDRRERAEMKRELKAIKYDRQIEKLSAKYPSLPDVASEFIQIVEKAGGAITLEELCKAKLDATTQQEYRTKVEQEALLNRSKAKDKKFTPGESKPTPPVRFSAEDESACKYYLSKNPGKTRSDYAKILEARKG